MPIPLNRTGAISSQPLSANAPYTEYDQLVHYQGEAQRLINEAVEAATQADALGRLREETGSRQRAFLPDG